MAKKSYAFALIEGVEQEMKSNPFLSICYQSRSPSAVSPTGQVLDIGTDFPPPRSAGIAWAIDEAWYVGWATGMGMTGTPAIARIPSMATYIATEYIYSQVGKLRHMTGGQANMPIVLWVDGAARAKGSAGQHTDVGHESVFGYFPGLKLVVPSNAYDAKGLMISAIRDPDPVVFLDYTEVASGEQPDVPDDAYTVPIGKSVVRQEGKDITIVAWAPASLDVAKALPELAKAGISAEFIDPRTLKPLDSEALIASVKKTGRLLVVDHAFYTASYGAHVLAEVAQFVSGAKFRRLGFPDAPGPGAEGMMVWARPDAPKIVDAAKQLLKL